MRERWIIGYQDDNKAYEFSYETVLYLLDTYSRWFPIKDEKYFLLKITNKYIKIETDFKKITYLTTVKKTNIVFQIILSLIG